MSDKVLLNVVDGVATVTLNRPDRLNAIDFEMLEALIGTLRGLGDDRAVRVVVLAGSGRSFCAGADIGQMVERTPAEWEEIVDRYLDLVRIVYGLDKPVIARCHGDVVGGGLGLAIASDFRIATDSTRFCAPFIKLALIGGDMSSSYFLPRLVGLGKATDMMMTGRFVEADEALAIGLASRVVNDDALDQAIDELAAQLAAGPPRALAFTKRSIRRSLERSREEEFDYEMFAQVQLLQAEDHKEGVSAFLEKRKPAFAGK